MNNIRFIILICMALSCPKIMCMFFSLQSIKNMEMEKSLQHNDCLKKHPRIDAIIQSTKKEKDLAQKKYQARYVKKEIQLYFGK